MRTAPPGRFLLPLWVGGAVTVSDLMLVVRVGIVPTTMESGQMVPLLGIHRLMCRTGT